MGNLRLVGIDHLSPSGANTLLSCERRFVARYGPETFFDPPTEATAIGGGFALALETGSVEAGVREYLARRPDVDPLLSDPAAVERAAVIAEALITHGFRVYCERFGDLWDIEREVTYVVVLPGTTRTLQVRVDGYNRKAGTLVEDKMRSATTLQPAKLENEVRQGKQLTAEVYGHWRATGRVLPISFRNLRKPDPRSLRSVPLEDIDGIVATHFDSHAKAVEEFTVVRTVEQLRQWEAEMVTLARKADALLSGQLTPIRNPEACHAFGRECPMLNVCQTGAVAA